MVNLDVLHIYGSVIQQWEQRSVSVEYCHHWKTFVQTVCGVCDSNLLGTRCCIIRLHSAAPNVPSRAHSSLVHLSVVLDGVCFLPLCVRPLFTPVEAG